MAYISEHEQSAGKDTYDAINEDTAEPTVKMVKRLLQQSKRASKELRGQWSRNYQFVFGGRQWPIDRPEWRFSEVVNTTWADIMTETAIQTDARPKTDYIGAEPSDTAFAELLKEINDLNWQKYSWANRVGDAILQSKWVHVAHILDEWNPELENGFGDIEKKVLDPYGCYWDPLATDISDARYFVYCEPTCTEKLKQDYPDKAVSIKPDVETIGQGYAGWERVSVDSDKMTFTLSGVRGGRPVEGSDKYGGEPMTLKIRCWIKDDTVEQYADDQLGEVTYVTKKKYPKGRYIVIAGNQVLEDHENGPVINGEVKPYEHGEIPVVRVVNYAYPNEYAGENEVTQRMGPQIVENYVWSYTLDTLKMGCNPKELFSSANREAAEKSSNEPGQVLILPDFNGYRREAGLGIPANMTNVVEKAGSLGDKVSGVFDVIRGVVDPAISSGILFDSYVEAAQIRPRYKNRNLDQALQRMGRLDAAMYLQFYTAQRTFRMTNAEGWPQYVSFFVGEENGEKFAKVSRTTLPPDGKPVVGPTETMPIRGIPDVQIVTGSSIPFAKAQNYNRAKELFTMGAIDQEALLEEIDFPGRDKILERTRQAQEAMQKAKGVEGAV